MPETMESVMDAALALPEPERIELIDVLIASVPSDRHPIPEAWQSIIQRRSAEIEQGSVRPIPWNEVKRAAREAIGG